MKALPRLQLSGFGLRQYRLRLVFAVVVLNLMVIGLGQFGRSLVLALAQQWAEVRPGEQISPTLVDPGARQ